MRAEDTLILIPLTQADTGRPVHVVLDAIQCLEMTTYGFPAVPATFVRLAGSGLVVSEPLDEITETIARATREAFDADR